MERSPQDQISIDGYRPGAIGRIVELHAVYYAEHWGFDLRFEAQAARELSEFFLRFDADRDGFWTAWRGDVLFGSIAIDGLRGPDGARLRWFIVEPEFQGAGVGRELMTRAMDFCRRSGHALVHLWTFAGLDAARALYERFGFRLSETHADADWGRPTLHQKFIWRADQT